MLERWRTRVVKDGKVTTMGSINRTVNIFWFDILSPCVVFVWAICTVCLYVCYKSLLFDSIEIPKLSERATLVSNAITKLFVMNVSCNQEYYWHFDSIKLSCRTQVSRLKNYNKSNNKRQWQKYEKPKINLQGEREREKRMMELTNVCNWENRMRKLFGAINWQQHKTIDIGKHIPYSSHTFA